MHHFCVHVLFLLFSPPPPFQSLHCESLFLLFILLKAFLRRRLDGIDCQGLLGTVRSYGPTHFPALFRLQVDSSREGSLPQTSFVLPTLQSHSEIKAQPPIGVLKPDGGRWKTRIAQNAISLYPCIEKEPNLSLSGACFLTEEGINPCQIEIAMKTLWNGYC